MAGFGTFRGYKDAKEYYLRQAIQRDLRELLTEPAILHVRGHSTIAMTSSSIDEFSQDFAPEICIFKPIHRYCQVQFKHTFRYYKLPDSLTDINVGEFAIVQSFVDRAHEDLGVVTTIYTSNEFDCFVASHGPPEEDPDYFKVGKVMRRATSEETALLPVKHQREPLLLGICQDFVCRTCMPMAILACEFQLDGKVLHVYYTSAVRIDYRPLVKFIVKKYLPGTRIAMKQISHGREFVPYPFAAKALVSGKVVGVQLL